jgi:predicted ribonuclease YlaK
MKILPKTIKARVNQVAHRRAQQYALMVRDSTLCTLQGMADAGMTLPELAAALAAIEMTEDGAQSNR